MKHIGMKRFEVYWLGSIYPSIYWGTDIHDALTRAGFDINIEKGQYSWKEV
jgi:hypothetical protein